MVDLNFNLVKSLPGSPDNSALYSPKGMFFKNSKLYVCDSYKPRIQIFNNNLEFSESVNLAIIVLLM